MPSPIVESGSVAVPASRQLVAAIDPVLLEIFGPPPILEDESRDNYDALYERARCSVAPRDVVEEIWVRDVVDLTWEVLRLRRLKAKFISGRASDGVEHLLSNLVNDYEEQERLVAGWVGREPAPTKKVKKLFASAGYDQDTITAEAVADNLNQVERLDQMAAQAEARRNSVVREMERRRDMMARVQEVIADAEFEDVTSAEIEHAAAA